MPLTLGTPEVVAEQSKIDFLDRDELHVARRRLRVAHGDDTIVAHPLVWHAVAAPVQRIGHVHARVVATAPESKTTSMDPALPIQSP